MKSVYSDDFVVKLTQGVDGLREVWGISDGADIKLLTLSENATFIVTEPDSGNKKIIRVHRPNYHSKQEIASEINWILSIREAGSIITPAPIEIKNGGYIASFEIQGETRYVVAFEFKEGKEPDSDSNLVTGFKMLGKMSAELHHHASDWKRPNGFVRKYWTFETAFGHEPIWGDWRESFGLTLTDIDVLENLCKCLENKLNAYGKTSDRFGLIHADLRLANLLLDKDSLSVIDFDDCGFSWFMYDFASAISFYEDSPQIPDLLASWLEGYRSVRDLDDEHISMIPTFILFRRLLLTAWIASHAETETARLAGFEKYTRGTVKLAKQYLKGNFLSNLNTMQTVKSILSMNAFDKRLGVGNEVKRRLSNAGSSSVLFYRDPIEMKSAQGCWMTDKNGEKYLDFYNNVPSVGHSHPRVIDAIIQQLSKLNTNSRYIVPVVDDYMEALKKTFPSYLSNVVLTCTGSEANDLAMRLAVKYTSGTGFIVTESAYHGNTRYVTEVSPSILKNSQLPPHVIAIPPPSEMIYGDKVEEGFAQSVYKAIQEFKKRGIKLAALLIDDIFSSDGIFITKKGFLKKAVEVVHQEGGIYIADEVQPGFGRIGDYFWAFQAHNVQPDIVTVGKPMGNGFPMAGVITKPEYLDLFCEDIGYFNTFGGNPVAAAAGLAVLDVIKEERLQDNAQKIGLYLKKELQRIANHYPYIGDIRGRGLFLGVDILTPHCNDQLDPKLTVKIIDKCLANNILIGAAGAQGATLKMRPPLCLSMDEAKIFIQSFEKAIQL